MVKERAGEDGKSARGPWPTPGTAELLEQVCDVDLDALDCRAAAGPSAATETPRRTTAPAGPATCPSEAVIAEPIPRVVLGGEAPPTPPAGAPSAPRLDERPAADLGGRAAPQPDTLGAPAPARRPAPGFTPPGIRTALPRPDRRTENGPRLVCFRVNTPQQPFLPWLHLPVQLRQHGVAEAHARPLVGCRRHDDTIRSWRTSPVRAWVQPLVEWARTPNSIVALAYDVDGREAVERLAAANLGGDRTPKPNIAIYRKLTGHAHAIYTLRRPVLRGANARPFPLAVLGRCSEWLRLQLQADAGFAGVLVANPVHADYDSIWLRRQAYSLDELRAYIPRGWRQPRPPQTDAGRNSALFQALMQYAGSPDRTDADIRRYAEWLWTEIDIVSPHAFTSAELHGIVKSVLRYRDRWRAQGWHVPHWIERQAKRGRRNTRAQQRRKGIRSGEVRRERTRERDRRILARLEGGNSIRVAAAAEDLPPSTVQSIRSRAVRRTTNTDDRSFRARRRR